MMASNSSLPGSYRNGVDVVFSMHDTVMAKMMAKTGANGAMRLGPTMESRMHQV